MSKGQLEVSTGCLRQTRHGSEHAKYNLELAQDAYNL